MFNFTSPNMHYEQALPLANRVYSLLQPHCERIDIAGSIRRKKPECGDIEIVCIPKTIEYALDLFQGEGQGKRRRSPGYFLAVELLEKVKGNPDDKYTQRIFRQGDHQIKVDIFTAVPENYGLILAIRTGSAEFSKGLAVTWKKKGFHSRLGLLRDQTDKIYPIRDEKDLFEMLNLPYVAPENREL